MYKAIIVSIEDNGYKAKVRIPFFNRALNTTNALPDDNLTTASICTLPGCNPVYFPGDIVYVDFEANDMSKPVILGVLYRDQKLSSINIDSKSINVELFSKLPADTSIGEIDKTAINSLTRISGNIQNQFTQILALIQTAGGSANITVDEDDHLVIVDNEGDEKLPKYNGPFTATSLPDTSYELSTKNKSVYRNILINKIPYEEIDDASGGKNVIIGDA